MLKVSPYVFDQEFGQAMIVRADLLQHLAFSSIIDLNDCTHCLFSVANCLSKFRFTVHRIDAFVHWQRQAHATLPADRWQ